MNVGGMILDIAVLVLLVVAILLCCSFAFRRSSPAQTDPFMVKESGAAAALLSSQAVPIPVLCKELLGCLMVGCWTVRTLTFRVRIISLYNIGVKKRLRSQPRFVMKDSETRFTMDMAHITKLDRPFRASPPFLRDRGRATALRCR